MRIFCGLLIAALAGARLGGAEGNLAARARAVLHEVVASDRSWVRVHAAEALIEVGEAQAMRELFLRLQPEGEAAAYRIGVWRVLATTAPSAAKRAECIARVERVYLDATAPDRSQAIETLGKLRHTIAGHVLETARAQVAAGPEAETIMPLWALQLAGEPEALARLTAALKSADATARLRAAYALRWLHPTDPDVLKALAIVAKSEPAGSAAFAHVLSAALSLEADHAQEAEWRSKLENVLATGTPGARFETCRALVHRFTAANLPQLATLLENSEPDTRVAAAWTILRVLARKP